MRVSIFTAHSFPAPRSFWEKGCALFFCIVFHRVFPIVPPSVFSFSRHEPLKSCARRVILLLSLLSCRLACVHESIVAKQSVWTARARREGAKSTVPFFFFLFFFDLAQMARRWHDFRKLFASLNSWEERACFNDVVILNAFKSRACTLRKLPNWP